MVDDTAYEVTMQESTGIIVEHLDSKWWRRVRGKLHGCEQITDEIWGSLLTKMQPELGEAPENKPTEPELKPRQRSSS